MEDVEGRPWVRVSCTTETEADPWVCLRVVGTDDADGMNLNSLDFDISFRLRNGEYHYESVRMSTVLKTRSHAIPFWH